MIKCLNVFWLVFLTACASLQAPVTMEDRIGYAQSQLTAAYNTIADLAEQRRVSKAQATELLRIADQAHVSLNVAKSALDTGDLPQAQDRLRFVQAILFQLEKVLKETSNE